MSTIFSVPSSNVRSILYPETYLASTTAGRYVDRILVTPEGQSVPADDLVRRFSNLASTRRGVVMPILELDDAPSGSGFRREGFFRQSQRPPAGLGARHENAAADDRRNTSGLLFRKSSIIEA